MKCAGGSARIRSKKVSGGCTKRRVRYWSSANGESVARLGSSRQQRLDLGGEGEPPGLLGVEQRLLPEVIAREQQAAAAPVPDREGEHAAQPREHPLAVVLVQVDQHLGVAAGPELVAPGHQLAAQRLVVVDLAVEDDLDAAVLVAPSAGGRPRGR